MGDPKKARKKYSTPRHPWEKNRLEEEKVLMRDYGFKNKKELWRVSSLLKSYYTRAKQYITRVTPQSQKEQKQLIDKLRSLGLLKGDATVDKILDIQLTDLMERRLQTIVFKKKMAHSISQARQFITHCHISVDGKKITSPSYIVSLEEESQLFFSETSSLANEEHPERALPEKNEA